MSYQSDIYTALTASGAVSALVGNRVFPDVADGSTPAPYIVFQTITTAGTTPHDGSRDVEFPIIQFSCWAKTKAAAVALGSALNGMIDGQTITGASDVSFTFSNASGNYDPESKLFGEVLEYQAHTIKN
jgi:hypothetical protein